MEFSDEQIAAAAQLAGLSFTAEECALMRAALAQQAADYAALREVALPNSVPPALRFQLPAPEGITAPTSNSPTLPAVAAPTNDELPFASIATQAVLLRNRQISAVELADLYLARLERYDPALHCVITRTADIARAQAQRADAELAAGKDRGALHGIPWGAKDLLATRGAPTTWGAGPYREQVFEEDAEVVRRLHAAGAVLAAKLTMGELAWGDIWFGEMTRNPWNLTDGSSGSSAGSAAAVVAGLVGFTIGSETWGSIVSPSTRCGATGLRPTFGRVSRAGAMALSWSMDKLGPICRSVEDCALVFNAIYGPDGRDTTADAPFGWQPRASLKGVRIGMLERAFAESYENREHDLRTLAVLEQLGAELVPITLPDLPIQSMGFILMAEAAAAFDTLTRSNRDDELVRQVEDAWPNRLRAARFIPAVEYIQANRLRTLAFEALEVQLRAVDLYVAPSFHEDNLLLTNLTGHPAVVLPNGFTAAGQPTSITFTGQLFGEATLLAAAGAYQHATDFHLRRPPGFGVEQSAT